MLEVLLLVLLHMQLPQRQAAQDVGCKNWHMLKTDQEMQLTMEKKTDQEMQLTMEKKRDQKTYGKMHLQK